MSKRTILALGLALGCWWGAEASIIRQEGKDILVNNLGTVFDRGSFRKVKSVGLLIPDWDGEHAGQEVVLKSLSLGYAPEIDGISCARYVKVRCDNGDYKSAKVVKDAKNSFTDMTGKKVPRLVYTFDNAVVKVGDVCRMSFYGENKESQISSVRYAAAAGRSESEVFPDFSFSSNGKRYFPVYELRLGMEVEEDDEDEAEEESATKEEEPRKADEARKPEEPAKPKEERKTTRKPTVKKPKDHVISLSLETPKRIENREKDDDRSYSYDTFAREVTVKSTQWSYKGKVSCDAGKRESTEVTVQALFLGRKIGASEGDRIFAIEDVGKFTFGGDNPKTQKMTFMSPAVEETKTKRSSKSYGYWGSQSSSTRTTREGVQYSGVVLRAIENGKIRKVVAVPSNANFVKLGKETPLDRFSSEAREIARNSERSFGDSIKKAEETKVTERLEGTGQSTVPGWMDDYYAALEQAQRENKWLLVVFSGSDWCGWCKVLADKVLSTERFQQAVKDRYILVYIDSPRDKSVLSEKCREQNEDVGRLLKAGGGVPSVNIVSAEGVKLKYLGGASHTGGGAEEYLHFFEEADKAVRLMVKYGEKYQGAARGTPEGLKALNETLLAMDGETMANLFMDDLNRLTDSDASYKSYYPYFTLAKPLEQEYYAIINEVSAKARETAKARGEKLDYSTLAKYRQQVFAEGGYTAKCNALFAKVRGALEKAEDKASRSRLQSLKNAILRQIGNN
ncbi:MAG: thioredoxin family protein [Kiritimatiellae bacterium]|nr:thioredoxin family protein [Kiritimatiellia bacterium]